MTEDGHDRQTSTYQNARKGTLIADVLELIDHVLPDETKDGLTPEEVKSLLSATATLSGFLDENRAGPDFPRLAYALFVEHGVAHEQAGNSFSQILNSCSTKEERSVVLATLGRQEAGRARNLAGPLRLALAIAVCKRSGTRICNALDPSFAADTDGREVQIDEVVFCHNDYRIEIGATCVGADGIRAARFIEGAVETLLSMIEKDLFLLGVRFFRVRFTIDQQGGSERVLSFTLHARSVLQLLMGKSLYDDALVFGRELIQNAVDATRLRFAKKSNSRTRPEVSVSTERGKDCTWIIAKDNGIGMDRYFIERYLTQIGLSFYRSPDLSSFLPSGMPEKFVPVSRFGIGFISSFMVADEICVETKMARGVPVRARIRGASDAFSIQSLDGRVETGTTIRIRVNDSEGPHGVREGFNRKSLIDYVRRNVLFPPVPVKFVDGGEVVLNLNAPQSPNEWATALERYGRTISRDENPKKERPILKRTHVFVSPEVCVGVVDRSCDDAVSFSRFGFRVEKARGSIIDVSRRIFSNQFIHIDERFASTDVSADRTRIVLDESCDSVRSGFRAFVDEAIGWVDGDTFSSQGLLRDANLAISWYVHLRKKIVAKESGLKWTEAIEVILGYLNRVENLMPIRVRLADSAYRDHALSLQGFGEIHKLHEQYGKRLAGAYASADEEEAKRDKAGYPCSVKMQVAAGIGCFILLPRNLRELEIEDHHQFIPLKERATKIRTIFREESYRSWRRMVIDALVASEMVEKPLYDLLPSSVAIVDFSSIDLPQELFAVDMRSYIETQGLGYYGRRRTWIKENEGLRYTKKEMETKNGKAKTTKRLLERIPYVVLNSEDAFGSCLLHFAREDRGSDAGDLLRGWVEALREYLAARSARERTKCAEKLGVVSKRLLKEAKDRHGLQGWDAAP